MEKSFTIKKREPSIVFGKGDRLEKDISTRRIVPGPGQYTIENREKRGVVIGRSLRSTFSSEKTPGPGAYKVPVKVAEVPRYIIPN